MGKVRQICKISRKAVVYLLILLDYFSTEFTTVRLKLGMAKKKATDYE